MTSDTSTTDTQTADAGSPADGSHLAQSDLPAPGDGAEAAAVPTYAADAATAHDAAGDSYGDHIDAATGALIGDSIGAADAGGDLADLHAALASLSGDAFAYLDVALDHLTSSSDLFDVPGIDFHDMPDDFTGS
jgi:hypothetical protein